jgi:hypothetical protein
MTDESFVFAPPDNAMLSPAEGPLARFENHSPKSHARTEIGARFADTAIPGLRVRRRNRVQKIIAGAVLMPYQS